MKSYGYNGGLSRTERSNLRAKKRRMLIEDEEMNESEPEDQK